jgi:hypothetical protein
MIIGASLLDRIVDVSLVFDGACFYPNSGNQEMKSVKMLLKTSCALYCFFYICKPLCL